MELELQMMQAVLQYMERPQPKQPLSDEDEHVVKFLVENDVALKH